jgi:hypothetical protein
LDEALRRKMAVTIKDLAVETPNPGFLRDDVRPLFQGSQVEEILDHVRAELIASLEYTIDNWEMNYRDVDEPSEYFSSLKEAFND